MKKKDLNPDRSAACSPKQNKMQKPCKHLCFWCSLLLKLHRASWLVNIVSTVTPRSMSRVIKPKIHLVKYRYLQFLLKIYFYLFTYLFLWKTWDLVWDLTWKIWDLKKNGDLWFGIWLNDLNSFFLRFEVWVKDDLRFAHHWFVAACFSSSVLVSSLCSRWMLTLLC